MDAVLAAGKIKRGTWVVSGFLERGQIKRILFRRLVSVADPGMRNPPPPPSLNEKNIILHHIFQRESRNVRNLENF